MIEELATRLDEEFADSDFEVFRGALPEAPARALTLIQSRGAGPIMGLGRRVHAKSYGLQLFARGAQGEYHPPRRAAERAWDALVDVEAEQVGAVYFWGVTATSSPFEAGLDSNRRRIWQATFLVSHE